MFVRPRELKKSALALESSRRLVDVSLVQLLGRERHLLKIFKKVLGKREVGI